MNLINTTGWTLLHFLWEGAAIAALLAIANAFLKRRSANARYLAACAAMLVMLAAIAVTFIHLLPGSTPPLLSGAPIHFAPVARDLRAFAPASANTGSNWLPLFVYLWFAGVCALTVRSLGAWVIVQRFRNRARRDIAGMWQDRLSNLAHRLRIRRMVRLCESALAEVPSVVGWLRPVVLLPASALSGLTPRQLEALLAHELAHIRRHDYLINLLQTAVETLLFYHPAVWWAGRRMRAEREHCCDDLAVRICGDVLGYARALARMEELRSPAPVMAMAASGGSLLRRIERLLEGKQSDVANPSDWLTAAGIALCAAAVWAAPHLPVRKAIPPPILQAALPSPAVSFPVARELTTSLARPRSPLRPAPKPLAVAFVAQAEPAPSPAPESRATGEQGFLAGLDAAGYHNLSVDELIELKEHGVTGEFIRRFQADGYHPTVRELISLAQHGVTPEMAGALKHLGYGEPTLEELIRLQIHGVTPEYAAGMKEAGLRDLSFERLISLRIHGAEPSRVRETEQLGFPNLSTDDVVRLCDHGVTPDYIRKARQHGFNNLTLDQIVKLKEFGILD